MTYPEYALIGGKQYRINTDFKVALRCFSVVNDPSICDEERTLAVVYLLFGFVPDYEEIAAFLDKATLFLQRGKKEVKESSRPDMDFEYDQPYIAASFMSDYRIDLSRANMHFWQFCDLLQGLTDQCALSRVRELRNCSLSDIKDAKTRAKIAQAQAAVALPAKHSREEIEALDEFEKLFDVHGEEET